MSLIELLVGFGTSFAGSMASLVAWFHFDLEGFWQQRRLEHGRRLDARQRESARRHTDPDDAQLEQERLGFPGPDPRYG